MGPPVQGKWLQCIPCAPSMLRCCGRHTLLATKQAACRLLVSQTHHSRSCIAPALAAAGVMLLLAGERSCVCYPAHTLVQTMLFQIQLKQRSSISAAHAGSQNWARNRAGHVGSTLRLQHTTAPAKLAI